MLAPGLLGAPATTALSGPKLNARFGDVLFEAVEEVSWLRLAAEKIFCVVFLLNGWVFF